MISFRHADLLRRAAGVVGDTFMMVVGPPESGLGLLSISVDRQPEGSDVFSGKSGLTCAQAASAVFTHAGVHEFTVSDPNGCLSPLRAIVWPAEALEFDELKYQDRPHYSAPGQHVGHVGLTNTPREREDIDRRNILRALARSCDIAAAARVLEADGVPHRGLSPASLGLRGNNLSGFGGGWT